LLQLCLFDTEMSIDVPIEDLVWCDFEANLKFAATFYKYFKLVTTRNPNCRKSYDPLAARNYQRFSLAPPTFVSRGTDAQNLVELAFAGIKNIVDYDEIKDVLDLKDYMDSKRVQEIKDIKDVEGVDDMDMKDVDDLEDSNEDDKIKDSIRDEPKDYGRRLNSESYVIL